MACAPSVPWRAAARPGVRIQRLEAVARGPGSGRLRLGRRSHAHRVSPHSTPQQAASPVDVLQALQALQAPA